MFLVLAAASFPLCALSATFSTSVLQPASLNPGGSSVPLLVVAEPLSAGVESFVAISLAPGFSVSDNPVSITTAADRLPATFSGRPLNPWPGLSRTAASVSAQKITFLSDNLNSGTLYGFYITGGINNPPAGGTYQHQLTTQNLAGAIIDNNDIITVLDTRTSKSEVVRPPTASQIKPLNLGLEARNVASSFFESASLARTSFWQVAASRSFLVTNTVVAAILALLLGLLSSGPRLLLRLAQAWGTNRINCRDRISGLPVGGAVLRVYDNDSRLISSGRTNLLGAIRLPRLPDAPLLLEIRHPAYAVQKVPLSRDKASSDFPAIALRPLPVRPLSPHFIEALLQKSEQAIFMSLVVFLLVLHVLLIGAAGLSEAFSLFALTAINFLLLIALFRQGWQRQRAADLA